MDVKVKKLTDVELMRAACQFTSGKPSNVSLGRMYKAEHSPSRTQLFWIEMYDIPTFVSVHFVRHSKFAEHFVKSNREDRGGNKEADRMTPVNHAFLTNAQELLQMARLRLCMKAHSETRLVMGLIREAIREVDPELADLMVPKCAYRNGVCDEFNSCGMYKHLQNFDK